MTAPTPNPHRELAEEIAEQLFVAGGGEVADRLVLTQDNPSRDLGGWCRGAVVDRVESRLRSSLPTLSSLLGELALVRGALLRINSGNYSPNPSSGDTPEDITRSALAPGSGKLAGEFIRASVEERLIHERLRAMEPPHDLNELSFLTGSAGDAADRSRDALAALLTAHPEIGEEVGSG